MPKSHSVSKAQLHNIIKISIGEKKKRKSRRRARKRNTRQDDQMELLQALSAKPYMRPIKQPDPEKEQNKLITSSLIASNAGVIQALNALATPGYTTGYAPPPFPSAPDTTTSPPQQDEEAPASPAPKEPQAPRSAKKRSFFNVPPLNLSPLQTPTSPQNIVWGEGGGGGAAVETTPATASDLNLQNIREYLIAHREYIPRKRGNYSVEDINNLKNENHIKELYRKTQAAVRNMP